MAIEDHHHHHEPTKPKALLPISFSNGAPLLYRECLKNHAASLGGHALDGCGEFMLSPDSDPSVPTSLTCAACGCHRNFHRRVGDDDAGDDDDRERTRGYYSAPHMLMALSSGGRGTPIVVDPTRSVGGLPRKRFRTRFSKEQKEKMQELSERLGWRLQKRDDALVEESCREIGVGRGVFKVWMHNNKHNFLHSNSKRGGGGTNLPTAGYGNGTNESNRHNGGEDNGNANGNGNGNANANANANANGGDNGNGGRQHDEYRSSPSPSPSS